MQKIKIQVGKDIFSANYDDNIIKTITNRYPGSLVRGIENPIPPDQKFCDLDQEILNNCNELQFLSRDPWQTNDDEILVKYSYKSKEQVYVTKLEKVNKKYAIKSFFEENENELSQSRCLLFNQKRLQKNLALFSQLIKNEEKVIEIYISERELEDDEILVTVFSEELINEDSYPTEKIIHMEIHKRCDQIQLLPGLGEFYLLSEYGCVNPSDTYEKSFKFQDQCQLLAIKNKSAITSDDRKLVSVSILEGDKLIGRKTLKKNSNILETISKEFNKHHCFVLINGQLITEEKKEKFQDYLEEGQVEINITIMSKQKCYATAYDLFKKLSEHANNQMTQYTQPEERDQTEMNQVFQSTMEQSILFQFFRTEIQDMMKKTEEKLKCRKVITMLNAQSMELPVPDYTLLQEQQRKIDPKGNPKDNTRNTNTPLQKSLILDGYSSVINLTPKCEKCNDFIIKDSIQLSCQHSYHEGCLKEMVIAYLNELQEKEQRVIQINCFCGKKIGKYILKLIDNKDNDILEKFYNLTLVQLLRNLSCQLMKCKNNGCQFFFINMRDYNQTTYYCEFCQRHYP